MIGLDGVPGLDPYLARHRSSPNDFGAQSAFAAILFERELYFSALYGPFGPYRDIPPERHLATWHPYPPTVGAHALVGHSHLVGITQAVVPLPYDLFGLKPDALSGLSAVAGRRKSQVVGVLLASAFAADLGQFQQAFYLAHTVLDVVPTHEAALARAYDAAVWLAARGEARARTRLRTIERHARRVLGDRWMNGLTRAREAHELDVRRVAWRARIDTEGPAFTRWLKTELELCQEERDRATAALDESAVPERFRHIVNLARRFGGGDDPCRAMFTRTASKSERAEALQLCEPFIREIHAWVARFDPASYPPEVAAFFWLLEALEDMRGR